MKKCLLETPADTYINPPDNTLKGFEITAFSVNGNPQDIPKWNVTEEDNKKEMKDTSFNEHISVNFEYTTLVLSGSIV